MDLNLIKNTAIGAAYKSAEIINNFSGKLTRVSKKGPIDLVTEADIASEKNIIEEIRRRFPDHEILAEESGLNQTGNPPAGGSLIRWTAPLILPISSPFLPYRLPLP